MRTPPCILVVDDQPANVDILCTRLAVQGYDFLTAMDGVTAVDLASTRHPDLILLDVMLPMMDGLAVCRHLKADLSLPFIPIILLTAKTARDEVVAGLEAGADDYLTKPVDQVALVARVKAMLRLKTRYDAAYAQATDVAAQAAMSTAWGRSMAQQLYGQMAELERLARLKWFVPPSLAALVVGVGSEEWLARQQRTIVVVCCEIQGMAALTTRVAPEQVVAVLQDYYAVMGHEIIQWGGCWSSLRAHTCASSLMS